jgi:hypothetical protein
MIVPAPRLGYYTAAHWLQGGVILLVIAALALGVLSALDDMKERAEKLGLELTLRNMRTGMQLAMVDAMMRQRAPEIATWVGGNPIAWLGSDPDGYLGACARAGRQFLPAGAWCFDEERRELAYRPRRVEHLRLRPGGGGGKCTELSWRVAPVLEAGSSGVAGLRLEAASPCEWVLEEN